MTDRLDRLRRGAFEAHERLDEVAWQYDLDTLYAPLGELLFWTTSLAEAMEKIQEPLYSGLAYARNCITHGARVVTAAEFRARGEPPRFAERVWRANVSGSIMWGFDLDPEPYDPASGVEEKNAYRRRTYNENVAREELFPVLDEALWGLGVNIWILGQRPLRKPEPPRRFSIPPGAMPAEGQRPL